MNLGETIQRLRTGRGMSQEDLATALEVSRQSVSKWETNASTPELDKLIKLSALFNISLDELVTGEKKEAPLPEPPLSMPVADPPRQEPAAISAAQKTAGGILLGTAAVVFLLLLVLTGYLPVILYSLPFLVCGLICLTVRRNAGLWCGWTLLGSADLFVSSATGISWSMILLRYAYTAGMHIQLIVAWVETLFTAVLVFATVMCFRKRPMERTRKKRILFIAGIIALVLLAVLPYWLTSLLPYHMAAYRFLVFLVGWSKLVIFTALLTALAQGILKRPET